MRQFLLLCAASAVATAAPMLRLSTSVIATSALVGTNPTSQSLTAANIGDGALSLSLNVATGNPWLTATLSGLALQFSFQTASLAAGTYTAAVTVSDPNAVDSPQVVTVTAVIGSPAPALVDLYSAPASTTDIPLNLGLSCSIGCNINSSTTDGGKWLSIIAESEGTLLYYESIHLAPQASMPDGTYTGKVSITGTIQQTIPVTLRLTSLLSRRPPSHLFK